MWWYSLWRECCSSYVLPYPVSLCQVCLCPNVTRAGNELSNSTTIEYGNPRLAWIYKMETPSHAQITPLGRTPWRNLGRRLFVSVISRKRGGSLCHDRYCKSAGAYAHSGGSCRDDEPLRISWSLRESISGERPRSRRRPPHPDVTFGICIGLHADLACLAGVRNQGL